MDDFLYLFRPDVAQPESADSHIPPRPQTRHAAQPEMSQMASSNRISQYTVPRELSSLPADTSNDAHWKDAKVTNPWATLVTPCFTLGRTRRRLVDLDNGEAGLDESLGREGTGACIGCFAASIFAGWGIYIARERRNIRHRLGIPGSTARDFVESCLCPCTVVQEHERTVFEYCVNTAITTQPPANLPMTLGDPGNRLSFITIPDTMFNSPEPSEAPYLHPDDDPLDLQIYQLYESGRSSLSEEDLARAKENALSLSEENERSDGSSSSDGGPFSERSRGALGRKLSNRRQSVPQPCNESGSIWTIEEEDSDDTIAVGVSCRDTWPNNNSKSLYSTPSLRRKPRFNACISAPEPVYNARDSRSVPSLSALSTHAPGIQRESHARQTLENWTQASRSGSLFSRESQIVARRNFLARERSRRSSAHSEQDAGMAHRVQNVRQRCRRHVRAISEPKWTFDEMHQRDALHQADGYGRDADSAVAVTVTEAAATGATNDTTSSLTPSTSPSSSQYSSALSTLQHQQTDGADMDMADAEAETATEEEATLRALSPGAVFPRSHSLPDAGVAVDDAAYMREMRVARFLAH